MEKLEIKKPVESNKDKESKKIEQETLSSLENIRKTGVFDSEFLNNITLVVFGEKKTYKFKDRAIAEVSKKDFSMQDFMRGKRVDFAGINPKEEFEKQDASSLEDKQFLPFIFFEGKLTYNEFVAHEIAHNLFDSLYIQKIGRYEEENDITSVSEEYRTKLKNIILPLAKKRYPNINIEKFALNRQQIAEIFALMHEREFCRRANENSEVHNKVKENTERFAENPEKILEEFNKKHNRNCTLDDFYQENHILSLIVAPLLEEEYPEWKERKNVFWK